MFVNSLGSLTNLQLFSAKAGQFSVPQYHVIRSTIELYNGKQLF